MSGCVHSTHGEESFLGGGEENKKKDDEESDARVLESVRVQGG